MANIYVKDDILMRYAEAEGTVEDAKAAIQKVVEENAPGGNDDE